MGICGMKNIGNSCYMNTALQCVSNCWELTNYFLSDAYLKDINKENVIGHKGILAKSYSNVMKNLWFGSDATYSPFMFKKTVDKISSHFQGYSQHDCQEFLIFVLDGLHEDLNRVLKKPVVEKNEEKNKDIIKSKVDWNNFLLRNQSVLVDLFHGQFKSELHCPDTTCQNNSTNFDPFLFVSLPLVPHTNSYKITAFFIFFDIEIVPIQLFLTFNSECNIMAFRNKIAKMLKINPFSFLIVKMNSKGEYDHLVSSSQLLKINNDTLHKNERPFFLFQIDPKLFYSNANRFYMKQRNIYEIQNYSQTYKDVIKRGEEIQQLFKSDYEEDEESEDD